MATKQSTIAPPPKPDQRLRVRDDDEVLGINSTLQQFTVADFIGWDRQKRLTLNPHFQRRSVWTSDGRSFLIDSMLEGFPMPKVYLRTVLDTRSQEVIRDVVDGQQRLRTILEFSSNRFVLNHRSEKHQGKRYEDLDEAFQHVFLSYPIGVEHLTNANDDFVLEVFSRLNSYTVPLNAAEKRHAKYQTEFKWTVRELASDLRGFLTTFNIMSARNILRMEDDAFFAELVGIVCLGVRDGGASALDTLYGHYQKDFPEAAKVTDKVRTVVQWMARNLSIVFETTSLSRAHQVLMLFAAIAHQMYGIPQGRIEALPERTSLRETGEMMARLMDLAAAVDADDRLGRYGDFVAASAGATTRMSSRNVRFAEFSRAVSNPTQQ